MKRFRDGQGFQGGTMQQTQRKYFPPQGKSYGGEEGKVKSSNDAELDYAKLAYGNMVAQLLESNVTIEVLVHLLRDEDQNLQQIFKKMRELRDTIKLRRPNALPFLRLSYYSGLAVKKSQFNGSEDVTTINYNDSPLDSIETKIVHTSTELDTYCSDIVGLLEGVDSRDRLGADKELTRMKELIKNLPKKVQAREGDGKISELE